MEKLVRFLLAAVLTITITSHILAIQPVSGPIDLDGLLLPNSLKRVQMQASLIDEPFWIPGKGFLVVMSDRSAALVDNQGQVLWRRQFSRILQAAPVFLGNDQILLAESGGNYACLDFEGNLVWEKTLAELSHGWTICNAEGRNVQVDPKGTVEFFSPNGSSLFRINTGEAPAGLPNFDGQVVSYYTADSKKIIIHGSGSWEKLEKSGSPQELSLSKQQPEMDNKYLLKFDTSDKSYQFSGNGAVKFSRIHEDDNSSTIIWGDSEWRLFVFQPDVTKPVISQRAADMYKTDSLIGDGQGRGYLTGLNSKEKAVLAFMRNLSADSNAATQIYPLLQSICAPENLPGNLLFAEDLCVEMLGQQSGRFSSIAFRFDVWKLLGQFPSFRNSERLSMLILREADPSVLRAALEYMLKLDHDKGTVYRAVLVSAISRWEAHRILPEIIGPLQKVVLKYCEAWPRDRVTSSLLESLYSFR